MYLLLLLSFSIFFYAVKVVRGIKIAVAKSTVVVVKKINFLFVTKKIINTVTTANLINSYFSFYL